MIRAQAVRGTPDGVSQVLQELYKLPAEPPYLQRWQPKALRDFILGPHDADLVTVTRYYPTLDPKVAVDFEPPVASGVPFYVEQKRVYCAARGIVYIPVFLAEDPMAMDAFRLRAADERIHLGKARMVASEDDVLRALEAGGDIAAADPELAAWIDEEAHRRIQGAVGPKGRPVVGAAVKWALRNAKLDVLKEVQEKLKDVRMGRRRRSSHPPGAAR